MMNVTLINSEISQANAVTHGGIFHADEVFATVLLTKVLPEVRVARTFRIPEDGLATDVIVYDIGGGKFDHHQKGYNNCRENGIKYSSFGLLWQEYGMQILADTPNAELVFELFDKNFVVGIDAHDNGQAEPGKNTPISISAVISSFNPNWDETINADNKFLQAVQFAEIVFDNALASAKSKAKAQTGVEEAIKSSTNGIMILSEFMPWQDYVFASNNPKAAEILYVVFPSIRGGYNITAVPDAPGSFGQRKAFPESWAGLSDAAMAEASGVETATFCHKGRFICATDTYEDAILLAEKAVKA